MGIVFYIYRTYLLKSNSSLEEVLFLYQTFGAMYEVYNQC